MARTLNWAAALLLALRLAAPATAQPLPADPPPGGTELTIDQLVLRTSRQELEALYRRSPVGTTPNGFLPSEAIAFPGELLQRAALPVGRFLWQGKTFYPDGTVTNSFLGVLTVARGRYYIGPSNLDGQPSLILDYSRPSLLFRWVRDEVREVQPNVYLGIAYSRPSFTGRPARIGFFLMRGPGRPTTRR